MEVSDYGSRQFGEFALNVVFEVFTFGSKHIDLDMLTSQQQYDAHCIYSNVAVSL